MSCSGMAACILVDVLALVDGSAAEALALVVAAELWVGPAPPHAARMHAAHAARMPVVPHASTVPVAGRQPARSSCHSVPFLSAGSALVNEPTSGVWGVRGSLSRLGNIGNLSVDGLLRRGGMADRAVDPVAPHVRQSRCVMDLLDRVGLQQHEAGLLGGNEDRAAIAHMGSAPRRALRLPRECCDRLRRRDRRRLEKRRARADIPASPG